MCVCEWRQHMDSALPSCWEGNNVALCEPQIDLRPLRITQTQRHTHTRTQIPTHTQIYIHAQPASCPHWLTVPHRDREERRGESDSQTGLFSQAVRVSLEFTQAFLNPSVAQRGKKHTVAQPLFPFQTCPPTVHRSDVMKEERKTSFTFNGLLLKLAITDTTSYLYCWKEMFKVMMYVSIWMRCPPHFSMRALILIFSAEDEWKENIQIHTYVFISVLIPFLVSLIP